MKIKTPDFNSFIAILPAWWGNTRQSWQMKTTVTEIKVSGTSRKTQHAKCMQFITAASWKPTKMTMKSQNRTDKDRRNENEAGNRQTEANNVKTANAKTVLPSACSPSVNPKHSCSQSQGDRLHLHSLSCKCLCNRVLMIPPSGFSSFPIYSSQIAIKYAD